MIKFLTFFLNLLGGLAITTLSSYSWLTVYEPKMPECLRKYKK